MRELLGNKTVTSKYICVIMVTNLTCEIVAVTCCDTSVRVLKKTNNVNPAEP